MCLSFGICIYSFVSFFFFFFFFVQYSVLYRNQNTFITIAYFILILSLILHMTVYLLLHVYAIVYRTPVSTEILAKIISHLRTSYWLKMFPFFVLVRSTRCKRFSLKSKWLHTYCLFSLFMFMIEFFGSCLRNVRFVMWLVCECVDRIYWAKYTGWERTREKRERTRQMNGWACFIAVIECSRVCTISTCKSGIFCFRMLTNGSPVRMRACGGGLFQKAQHFRCSSLCTWMCVSISFQLEGVRNRRVLRERREAQK